MCRLSSLFSHLLFFYKPHKLLCLPPSGGDITGFMTGLEQQVDHLKYVLTPTRVPMATAKPIGIVGMNKLDFLFSFVDPYTVSTKINVTQISTISPCQGSISGLTSVQDRLSRRLAGVILNEQELNIFILRTFA